MNKKNFSAPAKLMKSVKSKPKSDFHKALSNIVNIINNIEYENDKKKIDKVYNSKYPKDFKFPSDTYLLDKIYKKPRRKFTIIDVDEEKKANSSKPRRIFRITDASPENKKDSKSSSSKSKKFTITISNSNEKKMEKNILTGAKTNSKNLNYKIVD
jgi:hypothetical protein